MIIGNSQNFLRSFMNAHHSMTNSLMGAPLSQLCFKIETSYAIVREVGEPPDRYNSVLNTLVSLYPSP